ENDTNAERLFGLRNSSPYVKDSIHSCVVNGVSDAVNPTETGTKAAAHYVLDIPPGKSMSVRLRFSDVAPGLKTFSAGFKSTFLSRIAEADVFYSSRFGKCKSTDGNSVQRQAFAGLLW